MSDQFELEAESGTGTVGYLTTREYDRLLQAVKDAMKHVGWWRACGTIRGGDSDELRIRSNDPVLPLPAPWLAAHEITRLMQELNQFDELVDAAHDQYGQFIARLLFGEVETAMAKWPIDERPHWVRYYRCQSCNQLTLKYFPPDSRAKDWDRSEVSWTRHGVRYSAEVRPSSVRCTDRACGALMGETQWEFAAHVAKAEHDERRKRERQQRRLGARGRRAGTGAEVTVDGVPVGEAEAGSDDAAGVEAVAVPA